MVVEERVQEAKEFLELHYLADLPREKRQSHNFLVVNFMLLARFSIELSGMLLDDYGEGQKIFEIATGRFDGVKGCKVRFKNLPEAQHRLIWKLRKEDISQLISIKGFIRKVSEVLHGVSIIWWECPACGNSLPVLQGKTISKPSKCGCGRERGFRITRREMYDIQRVVVEEDPADLENSVQKPRRIVAVLKDDLCREEIDKILQPSYKVKVTGLLGDSSVTKDATTFKKHIEVEHIEVLNETYETAKFTQEEIDKFNELSKSGTLYEDMIQSIFPTIYGHSSAKLAIFLQLIGGVHIYNSEGLFEERGTIHVLLVGSPGCLPKCQLVLTPTGPKPIEKATCVFSLDSNGKIVVKPSIPIYSGSKEICKIQTNNGPILCSEDHRWYVIRDGITQVIQTKDLNITDILLQVYVNNKTMQAMWDGFYYLSITEQAILLSKMLSEDNFEKTERSIKSDIQKYRQSENKGIISKSEIVSNKNRPVNWIRSPPCIEKAERNESSIKKFQRTSEDGNKTEHMEISESIGGNKQSCLYSWKTSRTEKEQENIFKNSQIKLSMEMHDLWREQYQNGFGSSSQGSKQQKQQNRKYNDSLSIMPCKITCISKSKQKTEMYDLIVPDTNNFILSDGTISHNSGKTQILRRAILFLPNSRFTGGRGASGIGLVAAVVKDEELGGYSLEAGAMPMANKSMLAIDELDKIDKTDISHMNNAMVDLSVNIDKGNVHGILETDTIVLGAANPTDRIFDSRELIWKQIGLPKDFMDRFDLIFPIENIRTEEGQRKVADVIFSKYMKTEASKPKLPVAFVKKYISYARQNYSPELNDIVKDFITDNFINLVKPSPNVDASDRAYFSTRLLTNIIRLATAAAKARLSNRVTVDDAKVAIDILIDSLKQQQIITTDGLLDIEKSEAIMPKRKRDAKYVIIEIIKDLCTQSQDKLASDSDVLRTAVQTYGLEESLVDEIIKKLVFTGDISEPKVCKYHV